MLYTYSYAILHVELASFMLGGSCELLVPKWRGYATKTGYGRIPNWNGNASHRRSICTVAAARVELVGSAVAVLLLLELAAVRLGDRAVPRLVETGLRYTQHLKNLPKWYPVKHFFG